MCIRDRARELGLEPLADWIWQRRGPGNPETAALPFLERRPEIGSVEAALSGAVDICAERIAEKPSARRLVQDELRRGTLRVKKAPKFREQKTKFDNYEKFGEPVARVASHRYLACLLYTSDAADERSSVDLGGRRIIKKKTKYDHRETRTLRPTSW